MFSMSMQKWTMRVHWPLQGLKKEQQCQNFTFSVMALDSFFLGKATLWKTAEFRQKLRWSKVVLFDNYFDQIKIYMQILGCFSQGVVCTSILKMVADFL